MIYYISPGFLKLLMCNRKLLYQFYVLMKNIVSNGLPTSINVCNFLLMNFIFKEDKFELWCNSICLQEINKQLLTEHSVSYFGTW